MYEKKTALEPDPTYFIKTNGLEIRNYGNQYFFPKPSLMKGLKEIMVFRENNNMYDIPNGSVWVYDKRDMDFFKYNPEILKDDVGCGITGFLTEKIEGTPKFAKEVLNFLELEKIHIGGGNHFLDFCQAHPVHRNYSMIFMHSDYNKTNDYPETFEEAQQRIKDSKEIRLERIAKILKGLEINGEFYNDWTHNTVELANEEIIYRKGAINIKDSNYEGILALTPYTGFYLYTSDWEAYRGSMQHGLGKKSPKKFNSLTPLIKKGKYSALPLHDVKSIPVDLYEYYNKFDDFRKGFFLHQAPKRFVITDLVVYAP